MKTNKDMALQSRDILQTFVFVPPTIQKSVKSRDFAELYLRSFLTYHSETRQVY